MNDPFQPRNDELARQARKWFRENPRPRTASFEGDPGRCLRRLLLNVHEFSDLMQRAGGLLLGTMSKDEAFEYLQDTERRIAEARELVEREQA